MWEVWRDFCWKDNSSKSYEKAQELWIYLCIAICFFFLFATIEILFHCADLTRILYTVSIHWFGKFTSGPPRNLGGPWSKIITSFWAGEALRLKWGPEVRPWGKPRRPWGPEERHTHKKHRKKPLEIRASMFPNVHKSLIGQDQGALRSAWP